MRRHFEVKFGIWRRKSGGEGFDTHTSRRSSRSQEQLPNYTFTLLLRRKSRLVSESRSRTPVLGGGVQPEPVCVGLGVGAAQWRRAWSLSERAASSKIGSLRSFSGSGHWDLKRDQRDRFPPQTVDVAGPSGPRRALTTSQKLVSATLSRVSGLEAEDGSPENKQWQR